LPLPFKEVGSASCIFKNFQGNLYTWGTRSAGLGLSFTSTSNVIETPHRVEEFNNNVARVAMGHSHTAVVTSNPQK